MKTLEVIRAIFRAIIALWRRHGTKLLGYATSIVAAALLVPNLIPEAHMPYWLFVNLLLGGTTVKRGHTNTQQQEQQP